MRGGARQALTAAALAALPVLLLLLTFASTDPTIVIAGVLAAGAAAVKAMSYAATTRPRPQMSDADAYIESIEERFARGEINEDELEQEIENALRPLPSFLPEWKPPLGYDGMVRCQVIDATVVHGYIEYQHGDIVVLNFALATVLSRQVRIVGEADVEDLVEQYKREAEAWYDREIAK